MNADKRRLRKRKINLRSTAFICGSINLYSRRKRFRHRQLLRFHHRDWIRTVIGREVCAWPVISTVTNSTKRQRAAGAGEHSVEVDHAGAGFAIETIEQRMIVAEQ